METITWIVVVAALVLSLAALVKAIRK